MKDLAGHRMTITFDERFIFSSLISFAILLHLYIKTSIELFNALINLGRKESEIIIPPIVLWTLFFMLLLAIFYFAMNWDRRILGIDVELYCYGLKPLKYWVIMYIGLDLLYKGEFFHRGSIFIPIAVLALALIHNSYLYLYKAGIERVIIRDSLIILTILVILISVSLIVPLIWPSIYFEDIIGEVL